MNHDLTLGLGVGWRPELAWLIERRADLGFVEILAESCLSEKHIPAAVHVLRERHVQVVPHGISLSLGGADWPDLSRLSHLAQLAKALKAPLVSEHLAFVRAGGLESGHLLPLPRTAEALKVVVRNVKAAQAALGVPLALENIATLFEWPDPEMTEAQFLAEVLDQTGALLLLDVENLYANACNHGVNPMNFMDSVPLAQLAYVHVAGGVLGHDGLYHDTHAHAVAQPVMRLLSALLARCQPSGVMVERDDDFPSDAQMHAELDAVAELLK
jgi:uncharacterized protein